MNNKIELYQSIIGVLECKDINDKTLKIYQEKIGLQDRLIRLCDQTKDIEEVQKIKLERQDDLDQCKLINKLQGYLNGFSGAVSIQEIDFV